MNEIKLNIPQYINITRSFSHKLVPENHGIDGHRFAPLDYFASYGSSVPIEEATPEKLKEESNRLYELAKQDVTDAYNAKLEELRNPQPSMSAEDLAVCAKYIKIVTNNGSIADFERQVAADKHKLNNTQLDFLRMYLTTQRL